MSAFCLRAVLLPAVFLLSACDSNNDETPITTAPTTPASISLTKLGSFSSGVFNQSAAEIVAFDKASKRAFVVNGSTNSVDVIDLSNPAAPVKAAAPNDVINLSGLGLAGGAPNSVAVKNGVVAVAVQAANKTAIGKVGLFSASSLALLGSADVGALPDMLTFTPDGSKVLVANEGEPEGYVAGQVDPEGSVSILNVSNPAAPTVQTVGFASLNAQTTSLRQSGIRIFGPNATVAQDLEPEYISVTADGTTAYVVFQENNALGTINIATAALTRLVPLGSKNHALPGNAIDTSDRDNGSNGPSKLTRNQPLFGLYMPDAIATYRVGTQDFIVTANEGDAREWPGLRGGADPAVAQREDERISSFTLDATAFPNGADLKNNAMLGRLRSTLFSGDPDGDGDFDQLFALGARSFSIFRPNGSLVFDSGSDFEDMLPFSASALFNPDHVNNLADERSPNKGPEPEALALASFGSKTFAFIGLERDSGIMTYDITDPARAFFLNYTTSRVFGTGAINSSNFAAAGDLGPEGMQFVPAADSPNGQPLLLVANEVSGTTTIYRINLTF